MSEYSHFYDKADKPLLEINTISNKEQGWIGDEDWTIQIHYTNLYNTEKQNIPICVACAHVILNYTTFKDRIKDDLYKYYENYIFYAEPDRSKKELIFSVNT